MNLEGENRAVRARRGGILIISYRVRLFFVFATIWYSQLSRSPRKIDYSLPIRAHSSVF